MPRTKIEGEIKAVLAPAVVETITDLKNAPPPPQDVAMGVLAHAARGATIKTLAKTLGVTQVTLLAWRNSFPEIAEAYHTGRRLWMEQFVEDTVEEVTDAPLHPNPKFANADVALRRVKLDTARWLSSKVLPHMFGDNSTVAHLHKHATVESSPLSQLRNLEAQSAESTVKAPTGPVLDAELITGDSDTVAEGDCF